MNRTALAVASSCLMTVLLFHEVALGGQIFADRDMLGVYLPLFQFWKERVAAGEFPQWYPYDGLGQPFVGNVLASAFHPSKLLFLLMDAGTALKVSTLACFPLAFAGFLLLLEALGCGRKAAAFGGMLFAFNGYAVSMTNSLAYLMSMATMPWAFWLTVRLTRCPGFVRAFVAAIAYALILFAGEPQTFVLSCLAGGAIPFLVPSGEERRSPSWRAAAGPFGWYCVAMAAAAALTAVQWVPSLEMMSQASVGAVGHDAKATLWSLPPLRLLEIALGGLNGTSFLGRKAFAEDVYGYEFGDFWGRSILIGCPAVILAVHSAVKGVRERDALRIFLFASSVFILSCILGKHLGIYDILHGFPAFSPFRYPEKLFSLWMFTMAVLAAFGLDDVEVNRAACRFIPVSLIVFGIFALIFCAAESATGFWSGQALRAGKDEAWRHLAAQNVHAWSIACQAVQGGALFALAAILRKRPGWMAHAVAVSTAVILFMGARGVVSPAIPEVASRPVAPLEAVLDASSENGWDLPRVARISDRLSADVILRHPELEDDFPRLNSMFLFGGLYPGLFGVDVVGSYVPGTSDRFRGLLEAADEHRAYVPMANLFSAGFSSVWGMDFARAGGTVDRIVYEDPLFGALAIRNDDPMPRAYLSRPLCVADREASRRAVLERSVDFHRFAVLENCPAGLPAMREKSGNDQVGTASIAIREPERVAVDVEALVDGAVLVLTDAYYSGWKATVDGAPAEILPANHAVRGVLVPKGRHRVEFTYGTPGLVPSALASACALLAGLIACLVLSMRRRGRDAEGAGAP